MAFRTIVVSSNSKLELSLNYLVHRTIDKTTKILINEVHTIIVQSTQVSITSALISELGKNNIKVIFCDEKNNPQSEIVPYYGNHYSSKYIEKQLSWGESIKNRLWSQIIFHKINNQANVLKKVGLDEKSQQLIAFSKQIVVGDVTNREGHAAKVYFNSLFGQEFSRNEDCNINAMLNYGYSILLSHINRELVSLGYLTQIGIHHSNVNNFFNLSCDLMEPFRPIIDFKVKNTEFTDTWKKDMIDCFNCIVLIGGKRQTFYNAIKVYVESVVSALNESDINKILFFTDYEI